MKIINKKPTTITFLILSVFIYSCVFFIFIFIINNIFLNLLAENKITVSADEIKNLAAVSLIVGVGAGFGSWIFAKIDEHKAKKSPPSDPKP